MAIGCLRIAATWSELGLTFDEPQHFACGLEYLAKHVYRYETQHPPLARAMTAVLPFLSGARPSGNADRESEGVGLLIHSRNPDRFLTLMRAGILPFFLLACLVVFFWTRHTFGSPAAALATLLFTLRAAGAGARRTGHYRHGPGRLPGCGLLRAHPVGRVAYLEAVGTLGSRSRIGRAL